MQEEFERELTDEELAAVVGGLDIGHVTDVSTGDVAALNRVAIGNVVAPVTVTGNDPSVTISA